MFAFSSGHRLSPSLSVCRGGRFRVGRRASVVCELFRIFLFLAIRTYTRFAYFPPSLSKETLGFFDCIGMVRAAGPARRAFHLMAHIAVYRIICPHNYMRHRLSPSLLRSPDWIAPVSPESHRLFKGVIPRVQGLRGKCGLGASRCRPDYRRLRR